MYVLEFEIEGLPKPTNQLASYLWQARHKHSRRWKWLVGVAVGQNRPEAPLYKAKITLTRCSSHQPDYDGNVSGFKHILDGLKEAGVIVDDKIENIGIPDYRWERAPPKKGHIKVKVEELATNGP